MTALLDTSFLFALTDKSDRNYQRVVSVIQTLDEPLILPTVVLPEVCYLIASRLGHGVAAVDGLALNAAPETNPLCHCEGGWWLVKLLVLSSTPPWQSLKIRQEAKGKR